MYVSCQLALEKLAAASRALVGCVLARIIGETFPMVLNPVSNSGLQSCRNCSLLTCEHASLARRFHSQLPSYATSCDSRACEHARYEIWFIVAHDPSSRWDVTQRKLADGKDSGTQQALWFVAEFPGGTIRQSTGGLDRRPAQ